MLVLKDKHSFRGQKYELLLTEYLVRMKYFLDKFIYVHPRKPKSKTVVSIELVLYFFLKKSF